MVVGVGVVVLLVGIVVDCVGVCFVDCVVGL